MYSGKKINLINNLKIQLTKENSEKEKLEKDIKDSLLKHFCNYIQIGEKYEFKKHTFLKSTKILNEKKIKNKTFSKGDIIEWVKINKKSIVFRHILSNIYSPDITRTPVVWIKKEETIPNTIFRINLEVIYDKIIEDESYKNTFLLYVKRTESLNKLNI